LRHLSFVNVHVSDLFAIRLGEGMCHNLKLEKLNLSSNNIGCDGATIIINSIRIRCRIKELDLSKNMIGDVAG